MASGSAKQPRALRLVGPNQGLRLAIGWRPRLAFGLTNLPYAVLSSILLGREVEADAEQCASPVVHGGVLVAVSAASICYHAAQLLGLFRVRAEAALLLSDVLIVNAYALWLVSCFGLRALSHYLVPAGGAAALMVAGNVCKRRGSYVQYLYLHGAWHLASAAGLYALLVRDEALGLGVGVGVGPAAAARALRRDRAG